jgi:hypothetical protein
VNPARHESALRDFLLEKMMNNSKKINRKDTKLTKKYCANVTTFGTIGTQSFYNTTRKVEKG